MTVEEQVGGWLDDLRADLRDEIRSEVEELNNRIEQLEQRLNDHDDDDHAPTRSEADQTDYEQRMGDDL